jgi:hypothetical protein
MALGRSSFACLAAGLALLGCGSQAEEPVGPTASHGATSASSAGSGAAGGGGSGGSHGASPSLGAHGLSYYPIGDNPPTIASPAMSTHASGSTLVVSVGRGDGSAFALPSDNKGNRAVGLGTVHAYTNWPSSGTAVYAFAQVMGGADHVVETTTPPSDEITLAVVEVAGGTTITEYQWSEVLAGDPLTSNAVTTRGPATLVAFWWGDAGVDRDKTATPDNGFAVVDSILEAGALVQCAVATRDVSEAGSYDVTWTATPLQGAQLWLVAVE